jgi:hypothetical protein
MFDTGDVSRSLPRSLLAEPELFDDLLPEEAFPGDSSPGEAGSGPVLRAVPSLAETARRVRPTTLATERALPVLEALAGLLPDGLRRGITVGVSGTGARFLAMALVARATETGSWVVVVGDGDLGLAAAAEVGVALERLVVVEAPDPGRWAPVVATFVGAVDLVLVSPGHRPSTGDVRRLAARCRERGSVLVHLSPGVDHPVGDWPGRLDLRFSVDGASWAGSDAEPDAGSRTGPGMERGRLRARRVEVSVGGRGLPPGGRRDALLLPGPGGILSRP